MGEWVVTLGEWVVILGEWVVILGEWVVTLGEWAVIPGDDVMSRDPGGHPSIVDNEITGVAASPMVHNHKQVVGISFPNGRLGGGQN